MQGEWTYDVFLNFRGKDIRQHFIGHLFEALRARGIHTFFDDEELERGEEITLSLVNAIQHSRIAIPVFSPNYATSSFCLDELVHIMDCAKANSQIVFPVFYEVDPFHVRRHRGTYGEALLNHQNRFQNYQGSAKEQNMERLDKWKMALAKAANLSGDHFKLGGDESERKLIEKIVEAVSRRISRNIIHVGDYLVGLNSRVRELQSLLNVGCEDGAHMVGIHGIGGIGKSTLARGVYSSIVNSFDGACFLGNVRERSMTHGLAHLQEMLLSKLLQKEDIKTGDINEGISIIKHRLCQKKVLLIIDDVDNVKQLRALVGESKWFGSGSKIIITTRNKGLLTSHGVTTTYEVGKLQKEEALNLLRWNAFKTHDVDPSYEDILNQTVTFASGLPLALEVIGSNMSGKSVEEWKSALERYKRIPQKDIQKILRVSFDDLDNEEQQFFLDIACFFNGDSLEDVNKILETHRGVCPKYGIRVLNDKSLIKIDDNGCVTLHDLLQDMGREIVRQESQENPGMRTRLWFYDDIKYVLEENKGSSTIEMILMKFSEMDGEVNWDGEAFRNMINLKTLIIIGSEESDFSEDVKYLPNSLRVLQWKNYPSKFLPFDFSPKKLGILKLPENCLSSLSLLETHKNFMNLTILSFENCWYIKQIPDVSVVPNLEELLFARCSNLIEVHKSVGMLEKLRILDATMCTNLRSFPALKLISLESLSLSYCSRLESFPEILGEMEKLTTLELEGSSIKVFPSSIRYLTQLQMFEMNFSKVVVELPSSIFLLTKLRHFCIKESKGLSLNIQHEDEQVSSVGLSNQQYFDFSSSNVSDEFLRMGVPWFSNVTNLVLSWNYFTILPACIKGCSCLEVLILDNCIDLQEIRGVPPNIRKISAKDCSSLKELDLTLVPPACTKECRFLKQLILDGCERLDHIRGIPRNIELLLANQWTALTQAYHEDLQKELWVSIQGFSGWLSHYRQGLSISFWFRHKVPIVSLSINEGSFEFGFALTINNHVVRKPKLRNEFCVGPYDKLILFLGQKLTKFQDKMENIISTNEWNHVKLSVVPHDLLTTPSYLLHLGIYVGQSGSSKDIRFRDPSLLEDSDSMSSEPTFSIAGDSEIEEEFFRGLAFAEDSDSTVSEPTSSIAGVSEALEESSQALAFADGTQIPTSSSDQVSDNKELAAAFEESFTNQVPPIRHDDAEIEAFYASLDAGTTTNVLSCSNDEKSASPSEEAKEALKIVHDFISNDASVFLHPERCCVMKSSLDYLSKLSTDDGISEELKTFISEASWFFTHSGRDYVESSMKIESTTSEMQRAGELEAGLEANRKQFKDVVALEHELLKKLTSMEKSKKELEEQINAIKANLSACESEKKIVVLRKRDIFEEGKAFKAQLDELRGQVPRLQHEQDLAKVTREKIAAQWSKLGEKFKIIVEH